MVRLYNVLPRPSFYYSSHCCYAEAACMGYGSDGRSCGVLVANIYDLLLVQSSVIAICSALHTLTVHARSILVATRSAFGMFSEAMVLTSCSEPWAFSEWVRLTRQLPTFANFIRYVVGRSSYEYVGRIYADWVVAMMAGMQARIQKCFVVGYFPRNPVRRFVGLSVFWREQTVAIRMEAACPWPAIFRTEAINLRPEASYLRIRVWMLHEPLYVKWYRVWSTGW